MHFTIVHVRKNQFNEQVKCFFDNNRCFIKVLFNFLQGTKNLVPCLPCRIQKIYYISFIVILSCQVFPGRTFHSLASLSKEVPILSCSGLTKRYAKINFENLACHDRVAWIFSFLQIHSWSFYAGRFIAVYGYIPYT